MKSRFQTLSFLSLHTPKTPLDGEFINSFIAHKFQNASLASIEASQTHLIPLDVPSFISWFERGLEPLKIARWQNKLVMLGKCTLDNCEIIGSQDLVTGEIGTEVVEVPSSSIQDATEEEGAAFRSALVDCNLQPDPDLLRLVPRYNPAPGHRVVFCDYAQEIQGVGVVREITAAGDVVFFCYFTYPGASRSRSLGYSLHENPSFNLRDMIFQNIDRENIQTMLGNSTSCFRRLKRELERSGKVWRDTLLRIEPLEVERGKGEKYWYISDKLKVVTDTEKKTTTSHLRYLAGNYFTSHMAAVKVLGKINEILRDYLASETWPETD